MLLQLHGIRWIILLRLNDLILWRCSHIFPVTLTLFLVVYLFINFIEDQTASLTLFNILFYFSAIFPIYKMARVYVSKPYSFLMTAVIYSSSYVLVTVNQPMSEGAGLAALWWYFWSIDRAVRKNGELR